MGANVLVLDALVLKLKNLKNNVIHWEIHTKQTLKATSCDREINIEAVYSTNVSHILSEEEKSVVSLLAERNMKILKMEEVAWRLKSGALLFSQRNKNTSFFHRYWEHHRNSNAIWELRDS